MSKCNPLKGKEAYEYFIWFAQSICHVSKLSKITFLLPDGTGLVYTHKEVKK